MSRDRTVLFVGHEASRSGAPMVMLHFLRWFKANANVPFHIALCAGGDLEPLFREIGPVSILGPWRPGLRQLPSRARRRWRLSQLRGLNPRVIYANTLTNGRVVEALAQGGRPVVSHVHELETTIRALGVGNLDAVKRYTHRYIACSESVKANLIDHHGIDARAVDVVHEFIPVHASRPDPHARTRVFAELGIPDGALVVGAAGYTTWRKGPGLFVQLARAVKAQRPDLPVHFVWIGDTRTERFTELNHDVRIIGMEDRIHFTGMRKDPLSYFHAFDVFAMVSREDPFPLVCLEAASIGKPIVCFDGAGGAKEFVEDDCGFVVPYLDIESLATRTLKLLESQTLREVMGGRAAEKVRVRHDVATSAPRVLKIIEERLQN